MFALCEARVSKPAGDALERERATSAETEVAQSAKSPTRGWFRVRRLGSDPVSLRPAGTVRSQSHGVGCRRVYGTRPIAGGAVRGEHDAGAHDAGLAGKPGSSIPRLVGQLQNVSRKHARNPARAVRKPSLALECLIG